MSVPSNLIPKRVTQLNVAPAEATAATSQMLIVYNGVTYQVSADQIVSTTGVPTSRQVLAGTGLSGGGDLSADRTISITPGGVGPDELAATGVTGGTYGSTSGIPVITVDVDGRITAITIADIDLSLYALKETQVIAGTGLTGGGSLASNVTVNLDLSDATPESRNGTGSAGTSEEPSRADHVHPAVDLGVDDEVQGLLPMNNGGANAGLVAVAGGIVYSTDDHLAVGSAGLSGQVLVSGGDGAYTWGSTLILTDQPANYVYAGPASGPDAPTGFRLLVNADIPGTLDGKTLTDATVTGSTVDDSVIGGTTPAEATFTTMNATTVDTTNLEAANLKAKDGTAAGSIANSTGVVTLNSVVLTTADVNGGTIDATVIGQSTPASAAFTDAELESLQFDTNPPSQTDVEGLAYWNDDDGAKTLNLVMAGGDVVQQIGEEIYYRVKASSALTNGQCAMYTGSVGASGAITAAPSDGLAATEGSLVLGIATEDIATNGWGYVTKFGVVRGVNTANNGLDPADPDYETWSNGEILYHDPRHAGALTNVVPTAPAAKVQVASVIVAHAVTGSLLVRPTYHSTISQLSNVDSTTPAEDDILRYNTDHWVNTAAADITVGHATSLSAGAANQVVYQSASGTSAFTVAPTTAASVLQWSGSAYEWRNTAVANGLATLDSGGTVPTSQLPAAVLGAVKYQGTWNASTNTPTIVSSTGTQGHYYVVDTAGTTTIDGISDWNVGDWIIFNGSVWQKIDNTDQVSSVNGYTGTVVLDYTDVGAPSTSGTNATGTWSIDISGTAATAAATAQTLTRGGYLTGSNFNGSAATTWAVDATSAATAGKVVARDGSGNFAGNVITAASFVGIDGGTF